MGYKSKKTIGKDRGDVKMKLPNLLIVGFPKTGTTSLYHYLKNHPEIYFPEIKEPWFFSLMDLNKDRDVLNTLYKKRVFCEKEYLDLFKESKQEKVIGEASAIYSVWYKPTIKNISRFYKKKGHDYKKIKIIVVLRNPAERLISQYYHLNYIGWEKRRIIDIFKDYETPNINKDNRLSPFWFKDLLFKGSMYYESLKTYKEVFKDVLIILNEDLKFKRYETLRKIYDFLDIQEYYSHNINKKYNESYGIEMKRIENIKRRIINGNMFVGIKKSKIYSKYIYPYIKHLLSYKYKVLSTPQIVKSINKIYFEEDILKTQKLINRDLSHWLE